MPPRSPVIVVDDRWIGQHGIGRFAREVLARLDGWLPLGLNGKPVGLLGPARISLALRRKNHDLFFSPGFVPPLHSARPFVLTIHDLIHLDVPGESTFARRLYYRLIVRRAARQAACILTVSEYSRTRIAQWSGMPKNRIIVVGNGVSDVFTDDGPAHDAGFPYLLYVGNHKPHKNIPGLLDAFARLPAKNDVHLLFVGVPQNETMILAERRGIGSKIHFTGLVDDSTLATMYRGAVALAMPSFVEGFGLPAVEAMACGTPVVCSNTTSLPEVVGSAALLIDPADTQSIVEAMVRIANDEDIRVRLREAGRLRAAAYRWDDVADRVAAAIYRESHAGE